ncbi:MAG: hypothetical protein R2856_38925 [Caldilineaceae bacterium]
MSWQLLPVTVQQALARLSVFRGSITPTAARQAAQGLASGSGFPRLPCW